MIFDPDDELGRHALERLSTDEAADPPGDLPTDVPADVPTDV